MNCPKGCTYKHREWLTHETVDKPAKLDQLSLKTLSKSGKTLFLYYVCPRCKRIFRRGKRVFSMTREED